MELAELKKLDDKYILNSYKRYPLQIVRGDGVYVYDDSGKKYLDFLSGIAVNALGYGNKQVVDALKSQAGELIHISNLFYSETPVLLARRLCELSSMDKVFYCNSGGEANELAVKLARVHGKTFNKDKNKIICMKNSFHGRTAAALTITKSPEYGEKFYPLIEGAEFVSLNDHEDKNTSCIILEPVQGEGGVHVADAEYLQLARYLADEYNALLVLDEVQCGLGRTGTWFAFESSRIKPDILTLAKALGGGLPLGAVLMIDSVASLLTYGDHGTTFGGNCLAVASANAFLDAIESQKLLENVNNTGCYFKEQLLILKEEYSFIKKVRGKGLMLGVELDKPAVEYVCSFMNEGLISNCTAEKVIRFLPPYIITKENVDEAITIMRKVFDS